MNHNHIYKNVKNTQNSKTNVIKIKYLLPNQEKRVPPHPNPLPQHPTHLFFF